MLGAGKIACSQEEQRSFCFEGVKGPLPFDLNAGTARDVALLRDIAKILCLLHPSTDLALRSRLSAFILRWTCRLPSGAAAVLQDIVFVTAMQTDHAW